MINALIGLLLQLIALVEPFISLWPQQLKNLELSIYGTLKVEL